MRELSSAVSLLIDCREKGFLEALPTAYVVEQSNQTDDIRVSG